MPELPEVETVARTLRPHLVGRTVEKVVVTRADYIRACPSGGRRRALGEGQRVEAIRRRGKQLSVWFESGRVVVVHLGMTGQLLVNAPGTQPMRTDHWHVRWRLEEGTTIVMRDPRRFGGVWALASEDALDCHNAHLGVDALEITPAVLCAGLEGRRRAIKACLLDQSVLAGVGNIYADEALFLSKIHPLAPAGALSRAQVRVLVGAVHQVLHEGIRAGGATLRDFVDAEARPGSNQRRFLVYGRTDLACTRCGTGVRSMSVAQRTTHFCPTCQTGASPS